MVAMTPTEDKNRQAFERYAKSRGYRTEKRRGNYLYAAAQSAWEAWKAAQASMNIANDPKGQQ